MCPDKCAEKFPAASREKCRFKCPGKFARKLAAAAVEEVNFPFIPFVPALRQDNNNNVLLFSYPQGKAFSALCSAERAKAAEAETGADTDLLGSITEAEAGAGVTVHQEVAMEEEDMEAVVAMGEVVDMEVAMEVVDMEEEATVVMEEVATIHTVKNHKSNDSIKEIYLIIYHYYYHHYYFYHRQLQFLPFFSWCRSRIKTTVSSLFYEMLILLMTFFVKKWLFIRQPWLLWPCRLIPVYPCPRYRPTVS